MLLTSDYYFKYRLGTSADSLPYFYAGDSWDNYQQKLGLLGSHWTFSDPKRVHYSLNNQGYRCDQFEDIPWSESILLFGCSIIFGVGISDHETVPEQLTSIIGKPVINLAQGGSSPEFQRLITEILRAREIVPRAVIYVWPNSDRYCTVEQGGIARHWGSWNVHKDEMPQHIREFILDPEKNLQYVQSCIDQCQWSCPAYHFTARPQLALPGIPIIPTSDRSRDGHHPGPVGALRIAQFLSKNINL